MNKTQDKINKKITNYINDLKNNNLEIDGFYRGFGTLNYMHCKYSKLVSDRSKSVKSIMLRMYQEDHSNTIGVNKYYKMYSNKGDNPFDNIEDCIYFNDCNEKDIVVLNYVSEEYTKTFFNFLKLSIELFDTIEIKKLDKKQVQLIKLNLN